MMGRMRLDVKLSRMETGGGAWASRCGGAWASGGGVAREEGVGRLASARGNSPGQKGRGFVPRVKYREAGRIPRLRGLPNGA